MTCSKKQADLIHELQNRGAPIPCKDNDQPDHSMFESIEAANIYIKEYGYLMKRQKTTAHMSEWGSVANT